jgi:nucleotide-binding universal stress UspA family protein
MADSSHDPIVVGVDGSEPSVAALRYAARLAEAMHATLRAVITWEYPDFGVEYPAAKWEADLDAGAVLSTAVARAFGDAPPAGLRKDVVEGPAAPTLIDESEHARMLVVGARGAGGFARLLLGSVSEAWARHAHCPVLVVRDPTVELSGAQESESARKDDGSVVNEPADPVPTTPGGGEQ